MRPERGLRSAGVLKVSTLMHFHKVLTKQKYHLLFSPKGRSRPGPKGPRKEWIDAVVGMKRRNPTWGCKRIAQQITLAFGVDIDKDVVRRILGTHFRPQLGSGGPSWLSVMSRNNVTLLHPPKILPGTDFLRTAAAHEFALDAGGLIAVLVTPSFAAIITKCGSDSAFIFCMT